MSLLMSNDLSLFEEPYEAVLVGASGAIGQALCPLITADPQCKTLHTLARQTERIPQAHRETSQTLDFEDEESIETAFKAVKSRAEAPIRLILVVSGALHVGDIQPEKNWRQLDPASFHKIMTINALGPSLVAKHGLGLMPRKDKALFAAISARVGSISDNRLGGWYSYRASKSALNQILKTLSIEWARKNPNSICIGLHPGTVDSPLSEPFQGNVPDGKLFSPEQSAQYLWDVIRARTAEDSGQVFDWAGEAIPA